LWTARATPRTESGVAVLVMSLQLLADSVSVERGGRTVLQGLSFRVTGGEALLLTGPNGAGKSTLLRTLAGFLAPSSGRVTLSGADPELRIVEQAHFVGHLNAVKASLTVAENAAFWAGFLGGSAGAVDGALKLFGLAALADIPAGFLSAGQKRRLALVRLLIARRPLWLLDEPTAALDAAASAILTDAVDEHVKGGGVAVVATHLPLGLSCARELRLGDLTVGV
jgi:heme exporter protein A